MFAFINQGFQSHGHVCLDKKGKGSVLLLVIWLKRFSSSQSTGPQSSQLDPVCTHMPSVRGLIPESWGNGAGASGYKHLLKKKGAQPDLPTHAKRRQRLMRSHRHANEKKKTVLTNGVWKTKWSKTNGSVLHAALFTVISFMSCFFSSGLKFLMQCETRVATRGSETKGWCVWANYSQI